ncbi:MAG TPA: hypothetical protein VIM55_20400 [Mucilaginibacter sp.]
MVSIFLVSACIAVLSILSAYLQFKKDKDNDIEKLKAARQLSEAYIKLQEKSDQLQHKSDQIISKTDNIVRLQSELIVANEKVENLQHEVQNQLTGGNISLEVSPSVYGERDPDRIGFGLDNFGKYPVTDISITVQDQGYVRTLKDLSLEERQKAFRASMFSVPIINSLPNGRSVIEFFSTKIPKEEKQAAYTIYINWRNGGYSCNVNFERNEKGLLTVVSVKKR